MIAAVGKGQPPKKSRFFTIHHSFSHQSHSGKGFPVTNKRAACRGENTKKKGRCNTTLRWQSIKIEKPLDVSTVRGRDPRSALSISLFFFSSVFNFLTPAF